MMGMTSSDQQASTRLPDHAQVLADVIRLIDEHKPEPVPVTADAEYKSDLHFDSIGIMDLVADIEDHFEITIPLNDLSRMQTVGQTADHLVRLISAQRQPQVKS
jgi:acyl carrier protein